jgi:hypothetical protein
MQQLVPLGYAMGGKTITTNDSLYVEAHWPDEQNVLVASRCMASVGLLYNR